MTINSRTSMRLLWLVMLLPIIFGCSKDDSDGVGEITLYSLSLNGAQLEDGTTNIPLKSSISFVFSGKLDPMAFESLLSITSIHGIEELDVIYTNNSSKATIELELETNTTYMVKLSKGNIGIDGQRLEEGVSRSFTTQESQIITSLPPCTSVSECRRFASLNGTNGEGQFEYYSNYPIYEEMARWEDLRQAVIIVHGAAINPDAYYGYMTNTLNALDLSESTVLIAPHFKTESTGDPQDFYWSGLNWREGRDSRNSNELSSFGALDQLIDQLADTVHFPVLKKVIVTGQSSGGLFTHLFAAANRSEETYPGIKFDYIVSESQYFYYPDGRRINENTGQLYTPSSCTGYDLWPFGFDVVPDYLSGTQEGAFVDRFVERHITYLLGGANMIDGSLNTSDCSATLLGSTRFKRGENMAEYMDLVYPGIHQHNTVVVPGVNHQGSVILQSQEFQNLLTELLR